MSEEARPKRARLGRFTVAAAVLAVFLVVLGGLALGGSGASRGAAPSHGASSWIVPAALVNTLIDLNRSQSAGTYVSEYVTLNNGSTLTKLPASLTVAASACDWVIVSNFTAPASPVSVFHNVQFHNVTSANDTGTLAASGHGFKVCGGTGLSINYVYWTYSIYEFSATGIGVNTTVTLGGFSDWTGTTVAPANVSATIGPKAIAVFTVSSNLTFTAIFTKTVNGPTSCDATGQVCSFSQYSFVSVADTANVSKSTSVAFTAASGLRVTAAYENWTVGYSSATVPANTAIGGFFSDTSSVFQSVFVQFWYLWIVGLLVIALVFAAMRNKRGRRR